MTRVWSWPLGGVFAVVGILAAAGMATGQATLQTRDLRLTIAADGRATSLASIPSGVEYLAPRAALPFAVVYRGGQMAVGSQEDFAEDALPTYRGGRSYPASGVRLQGDQLTVRFGEAKVTATYRVTQKPDYLAFRLMKLEGDPVDRIDLVRLGVRRLPQLGSWINVAYDDRFGVCLCGGNVQTTAGMTQRDDRVEMAAVATREVELLGATAVLFGCQQPRDRFLDAMEIVERDFGLPAGAANRKSPAQKRSYLWCSPTLADVDQYIALAKRGGFRTLLFSYTAFTQGAGHFFFNDRFPGGMADLKKMTDRIRAAGLGVGLHIHYSKAVRTDPYVTPVPDDRLHATRAFTLAEAADAHSTTIPVRENPTGSTRTEGRRILQIGKELVAYRDYTEKPPFQFTGCERGHLKTAPAEHASGAGARLLDVDDWIIFLRFDQQTDIQDEAARRIAAIYRETGPYEMVYFDGAEDVHDPFWYHVAAAQHRVYRLLEPPPPVCEAAMSTHFSWHMMTRGNAFDVVGAHIKPFVHQISCRTAPVRAVDFTRINFGWIAGFYRHLGPDTLEYVLSRGAAWDCPFSQRVTRAEVAAHPRAEDCFEVIRTWENARIEGKLSPSQLAMLKTLDPKQYQFIKTWPALFAPEWIEAWSKRPFSDQEHHLFVNERGEHELVPIREVALEAARHLKAFLFQRAGEPSDTYALVWRTEGEADYMLAADAQRVRAMRPFNRALATRAEPRGVVVSIGARSYLRLAGQDFSQAAKTLESMQEISNKEKIR